MCEEQQKVFNMFYNQGDDVDKFGSGNDVEFRYFDIFGVQEEGPFFTQFIDALIACEEDFVFE